MGYPFKQLFRLIALTGVRRTEACGARWGEFLDLDDPAKARWEIPAARFKSNATHLVPLSADALAVLATVPRFQRGDAAILVLVRRDAGNGTAPGQGDSSTH